MTYINTVRSKCIKRKSTTLELVCGLDCLSHAQHTSFAALQLCGIENEAEALEVAHAALHGRQGNRLPKPRRLSDVEKSRSGASGWRVTVESNQVPVRADDVEGQETS